MNRLLYVLICLLALLIPTCLFAFGPTGLMIAGSGSGGGGGGGGGPDTYYYTCTGADTYNDNAGEVTGYPINSDITIGASGDVTHLEFKCAYEDATPEYKLAIYNTSGTRLDTGCDDTGVVVGWNGCELSSSYAVTTNDVLSITISVSDDTDIYHHNTGDMRWVGGAHSSFPATSYTFNDESDKCIAFRVYVD